MYHDLMIDNIDKVIDKTIKDLKDTEREKTYVARSYNKKVKNKSFQVRDLVWKTILPLGKRATSLANSF